MSTEANVVAFYLSPNPKWDSVDVHTSGYDDALFYIILETT